MAMSRQKKLDKMEIIELAAERPKQNLTSKQRVHQVATFLKQKI